MEVEDLQLENLLLNNKNLYSCITL